MKSKWTVSRSELKLNTLLIHARSIAAEARSGRHLLFVATNFVSSDALETSHR